MTSKISHFPGTPLHEDDFASGKILFNYDRLKGDFAWDTGIAISRYLDGLKAGQIIGARCDHCRKVVVPPRTVCEWCFHPMHEFVALKDTGTINTFSLCYVTWDMKRVSDPLIPAVIEIDGAAPLHGIMHLLGEVDPQAVSIGMRVQAVWKPDAERIGAVTDIAYFKPLEEAEQ